MQSSEAFPPDADDAFAEETAVDICDVDVCDSAPLDNPDELLGACELTVSDEVPEELPGTSADKDDSPREEPSSDEAPSFEPEDDFSCDTPALEEPETSDDAPPSLAELSTGFCVSTYASVDGAVPCAAFIDSASEHDIAMAANKQPATTEQYIERFDFIALFP